MNNTATKKNENERSGSRAYRLFLVMLALALLSMCLMFVTVGRYSTNDGFSDSARVAAFGVRVRASDESSFETEYTSVGNTITVKSSNGDRVVAPGTADPNGIKFTVKGTPEVETELIINMDVKKDVFLMNKIGGTDVYYYPVVFSLYRDGALIASGNLNAIKDAFDDVTDVSRFAPGTVLDTEFELTWEWPYDSTVDHADEYDTELGDMAAGLISVSRVEGENYSLDIEYTISITVNQVD